uniref:DUF834 domain-containing protein n=1 Tax=Oryza punctata TaxID=4537 RepID=A0A1V1H0L1_ORYPU|nr:hypothetical protein [Oryza punctata]
MEDSTGLVGEVNGAVAAGLGGRQCPTCGAGLGDGGAELGGGRGQRPCSGKVEEVAVGLGDNDDDEEVNGNSDEEEAAAMTVQGLRT